MNFNLHINTNHLTFKVIYSNIIAYNIYKKLNLGGNMNKFKTLNDLLNQDISSLSDEDLKNMVNNGGIDDIAKILVPVGILLSLVVIVISGIIVYISIKSLSLILDYRLAIAVIGFIMIVPLYPITIRVIKIAELLVKIIFKSII